MTNKEKQRQLDEISVEYYAEIFVYIKRRVRTADDVYDLTQEVFLALTHAYDEIDSSKIRKWLYQAAHNKIVDYYQTVKKKVHDLHREYGVSETALHKRVTSLKHKIK